MHDFNFTIDMAGLANHLVQGLYALAHAAVSASTMGTTASDLPPGIIG